MKKSTFSIALLATLFVSGCSSTGSGTSDGSFTSAFNNFTNMLTKATPFIQESEEWDNYGIEKSQQGLTYSEATAADQQFVTKKMDTEYVAAIDRLSRPFAKNDEMAKELDNANKNYHFTYNQMMAVREQKTNNIIGYCVNYDSNRWENGQPTSWDTAGNVQKHFIYVDRNRPISVATANEKFIIRMCGSKFYNQYKK